MRASVELGSSTRGRDGPRPTLRLERAIADALAARAGAPADDLRPSALGDVLFAAGVRRVQPTAAAVATMLEPLTAAVLAAVCFGERLGPGGAAGAVLLVGAVTALYRDGGS